MGNLVRTLYTLSNATARLQSPLRGNTYISPFSRTAVLRSMPSLPFLSSFFGTSAPASETMSYSDGRSNDEWRAVLNKEQFRVLREKGTEAPFTGVYTCAGCNAPLYKVNHKFKSGCGWPAYFDSLP